MMGSNIVIDGIMIHYGRMPVRLTFSYGKVESFPFIILRMRAGEVEGVGETLALPDAFLRRLCAALVDRDARSLDALLPLAQTAQERSICDGVSLALHDLVGKCSGLPLRTLLGGSAGDRVTLMPCIFPNTPDEAAERAGYFYAQGYRYLKTKLTGELADDIAKVTAIRTVAPPGAVLQGDANQGYKTLPEAREAIERLGAAGLDIFEDPLEGGVADYRQLKGTPGAKVMIDMLARRTCDLAAALKADACDMVNIHPVQPGGLRKVLQHAQLVQSFGVPVIIGGTGYTAVGSAAYQQLSAAAVPAAPCGELGGFFDHGMPRSLVKQSLPMHDGAVTLGDAPGSGVELDEEALAEFAEGREEWR